MQPSRKATHQPASNPATRGIPAWGQRRLTLALALAVMLTAVLGAASARSAAAQVGPDQYDSGDAPSGLMVEVTGTLDTLDPATYGYGEYQITDEESGALYALEDGGQGLLEPYVGQRVTVTGTEPAAGQPPQDPRLLNVMQVEPAGESPEGPGNTGSITFEVDTEGTVPQGAKFFGVYGEPTEPHGEIPSFKELGMVNMHDSDEDGTYTGVADVPRGETLALVVQGDAAGPETQVYPQSTVQRDATITVDGNETVSTTINFPESPAAPGGSGGSSDPGADQYESGDTDGATGKEPRDTERSGVEIEVLPDTGGANPLALAGLTLIGAGIATTSLRAARRR